MKFRLMSFLVCWVARALFGTLRLRVVGEERVADLQAQGKGMILVSWHGRTFLPIMLFRHRGYLSPISTSRDGEYQFQIFKRFGYQTVRGSSSARGAVQAALTMARHLKQGTTVAFAPDGPRGPSHQVQLGVIFLAQKSGCPIIPAGISASPRKLLRAWDRYMVPFPFARATLIYGEPIHIPADAKSEEEQQIWADRVGEAINALEIEAERAVGIVSPADSKPQDASQWRRA